MLFASTAPLVSPQELEQQLSTRRPFVLDIRSAESGGHEAFAQGHIPGAVHSDYAIGGWRTQKGGAGGILPNPNDISSLLGQLGLTADRPVVIVSAGLTPNDFSAAARVFWTLKVVGHKSVSILDGGYAAWVSNGRPVEAGPSQPTSQAPYPIQLDHALRSELDEVTAVLQAGKATLLDGRSQAQFEGHEKSPQAARPGRLPGAQHLDHTRAFEPGTGRLRAKEELSQIFTDVAPGPVVSYCNTGHLASTNWFVLTEILGRSNVSLYDGSMSEWTYDPKRPVEAGPGNPRSTAEGSS